MQKEGLPKEGIIFLDNSVFGPNINHFNLLEIKGDIEKLSDLKKSLSTKNNWLIIPEVIEEFEDVNQYLFARKQVIGESRTFGDLAKKFSSKKARKIISKNLKKIYLCSLRPL